jgi:diguanylate cyclase (GGDEF)-like protein
MVAERLREQVAAKPLVYARREIRTTVSIGVAAKSEQTTALGQLFGLADKALYEAKRTGRNRVRCYLGQPDTSKSDPPAVALAAAE